MKITSRGARMFFLRDVISESKNEENITVE